MAEPFDTAIADAVVAITPLTAVDQGVTALIDTIVTQLGEAGNMAWELGATVEQVQPYVDLVSAINAQATALAAAVQANTPAATGPSAVTAPAGPDPQPGSALTAPKGWPTTGENPDPPTDPGAPSDQGAPPPDAIPTEGELPGDPVEGEVGPPEDCEEDPEARRIRLESNLARRRAAWAAAHRPKGVVSDPNALPAGYRATDQGPVTDAQSHGEAPIAHPAWAVPFGASPPPVAQPAEPTIEPEVDDTEPENGEPENGEDAGTDPDKPRRRHRGKS